MEIIGPRANTNAQGEKGIDVALFQQFLSDPSTSIPIDSNFIVNIERFPEALKNFVDGDIRGYEPGSWDIGDTNQKLTDLLEAPAYNHACLFANGITIPNETIGARRIGPADDFGEYSGGLISGIVSTSRTQKAPLDIVFLETTDSFIDAVIRPWIIATSHYGLFAREPGSKYNVKSNISLYMYDSRSTELSKIRKKFVFIDCAPLSVEDRQVVYGVSDVGKVKCSWTYSYYTVETFTNNGKLQ